jgi:hypothetical protein
MENQIVGMKENLRMKWLVIGGFGLINCWLLYVVLGSLHAKGAGSAQADMEAFMYLLSFGSFVVIGSLVTLAVVLLTNIKATKLSATLARNPLAIGSLLNIAVPISLYFFL